MKEIDKASPEKQLLREGLKKVLAAAKLQNERLLEEVKLNLVEEFGGAVGLAKTAHQEYLDAPEGGSVRASILKDIIRLLQTSERNSETTDVGDMSDDDLDMAIAPVVARSLEQTEDDEL